MVPWLEKFFSLFGWTGKNRDTVAVDGISAPHRAPTDTKTSKNRQERHESSCACTRCLGEALRADQSSQRRKISLTPLDWDMARFKL